MPNVSFLGCIVGTDINGNDITINLATALTTTGGGAGLGAGYQVGDFVLLATWSVTGGVPNNDTNGNTWVDLLPNVYTNNATAHLYYRFVNATDVSTVPSITINGTGTAGNGLSVLAMVFRSVNPASWGLTSFATYSATIVDQNSTNPNPGQITSTPGVDDFILALYFSEIIDTSVTTPTNYNLIARAGANATTRKTQIGGAWRQLSAPIGSTEDPPAFTTFSTGGWAALTIPLSGAATIISDSVTETVATSTAQTGTVIKKHGESAAITDVATAIKVNNDGRVVGGVYTVNFPLSGWSGRTLRQIFTTAILAQVPPGPMGARLEFAAGTSTTIGPAYIGHAAGAGDAYDFDGSQVQLTFDGGSTTKVVSGAASIDTDKVSFPGYDPTKNLIVSCYLGAGTVNPMGYGF